MPRKSVSSTTKNKKTPDWFIDFQKNWKKSAFAGSLALLLMTSVGYAGWSYYGAKNQSQAATLPRVTLLTVTTFHGCKTSKSTGYGPIYYVRYYLKSLSTHSKTRSIRVQAKRDAKTINGVRYQAATLHNQIHVVPKSGGKTTEKTTFLSQILGDYLSVYDVGNAKTTKIKASQIPNC